MKEGSDRVSSFLLLFPQPPSPLAAGGEIPEGFWELLVVAEFAGLSGLREQKIWQQGQIL
jgi:hypothetical protein